MANKRISELQEIPGASLTDQDLFTVVQVAEADPTIRNKKLTLSGTKVYLSQAFIAGSGGTISGNLTIQSGLVVSGTTSFLTLSVVGSPSTFNGLIVQNNITVTGIVSGSTITGTTIQGTSVEGTQGNFTTVTGVNVNSANGTFTTSVSGTLVTGTTVAATTGNFTSLAGTTITGTTINATTITGISGVFTSGISGVTITGTTVNATTGTFQVLNVNTQSISGALTVTGNLSVSGSGIFGAGVIVSGTLSGTTITGTNIQATNITGTAVVGTTTVSGATITGNIGKFSTVTGITGVFTGPLQGDAISGNTGNFTNSITAATGIFPLTLTQVLQVSGTATVTGALNVNGIATFGTDVTTSGTFSGTTITGTTVRVTTITGTSGVFTSGISGVTITGTTVSATTGIFGTLVQSNVVTTGNATIGRDLTVSGSGFFTSGISVTGTISGTTVLATTGTFTTLTGTTTTGVTATFTTGVFTVLSGTIGSDASGNTKIGSSALSVLTTGSFNTAVGSGALKGNTGGIHNVAVGYLSLTGNTVGTGNVGIGSNTLVANTTGSGNIGIGLNALNATNALGNIGIGSNALLVNTVGSGNIAIGVSAGSTLLGTNNIIVGSGAQASTTTATGEITLGNANTTAFRIPGIKFVLTSGSVASSTDNNFLVWDSSNAYWKASGITTLTGTTASFTNGSFTNLTGTTVTGSTGSFGSGIFAYLSGTTITGTTVLATNITGVNCTITSTISGTTITGTNVLATNITGSSCTVTATFSGATITGTNVLATNITGVNCTATTTLSGATITGTNVLATNITGSSCTATTTLSGATITGTTVNATTVNAVTTSSVTGIFSSGLVATPSITFTGNLNTGLYNPAANQLAFTTSGIHRGRFDNGGSFIVGHTDPINIGTAVKGVQIYGLTTSAGINIGRYSADASAPQIALGKSRGATIATNTALVSGDVMANINGYGNDGFTFIQAAQITYEVDGTVASGDVPGRITFGTRLAGGALSEVLRLKSTGEAWFQANNTTSAVTITQTGAGNTLVVEDSANPDASPYLIDGNGVVVQGTTTALTLSGTGGIPKQQLHTISSLFANGSYSTTNWGTNGSACGLYMAKARGDVIGTYGAVVSSDALGDIRFAGSDGAQMQLAGLIRCEADGTPASGTSMPGRLVFQTTPSGAVTYTEKLRITHDGVIAYAQPTPATADATTTLTIDQLKTGIITSSTAAAVSLTLPTGTLTEGGFNGFTTGMAFEWSVINTGATNAITLVAGTGHTLVPGTVGQITIAAGQSSKFATRKTSANVWVTYRIA